MSGPHGSDQQWQPPGEGGDPTSEPTQAGSPWQQQPDQDATWQSLAYTPPEEYPPYQQPTEQAYLQQPQYGQPGQYGQPQYGQPGQYGQPQPDQYGQPGQYGQPQPDQYGQPGQYGQPQYGQPGQYGQPQYGQPGQPGQYPQQYQPYEQPGKQRSVALIGGVAGVIAFLLIAVVLVLGFWEPGFFVTTKLDVKKAQAGVQQVLADETNGYGARNVKDINCNHGQDPTVKKGGTFDCSVSIDGAQKHVTVTFQDNKGTYEVGRPQ
jgi:hypothetical protein